MAIEFINPVTAGVTLIREAIQSQNFVTGSAGWQIEADGSAEFNDIVIRGGTTTQGQVFVYNGTPAAGNMILSISPTAGTDAFGNAYPVGEGLYGASGVITFYDSLGNDLITMNSTAGVFMVGSAGNNSQLTPSGQLYLGTSSFTDRGEVFASSTGLHLVSPSDATGTADAETRLILAPGDADGTPKATAQLGVITSATDTDFTVLGTIISTPLNPGTPGLSVDLPNGATADLLDLAVNGTTLCQVTAGGSLTALNMDWGTAQTPAPGGAPAQTSVSVSFGQTFPATPRVVATPNSSSADLNNSNIRWAVDNVTTTGFDLNCWRDTNAATNFDWHALSN